MTSRKTAAQLEAEIAEVLSRRPRVLRVRFSKPGDQGVMSDDDAHSCRFRIQPGIVPRRANALCVEVGAWPAPRCTLKLPEHWTGKGASALRWLGSGGSPLVFGRCSACCPLKSAEAEEKS